MSPLWNNPEEVRLIIEVPPHSRILIGRLGQQKAQGITGTHSDELEGIGGGKLIFVFKDSVLPIRRYCQIKVFIIFPHRSTQHKANIALSDSERKEE